MLEIAGGILLAILLILVGFVILALIIAAAGAVFRSGAVAICVTVGLALLALPIALLIALVSRLGLPTDIGTGLLIAVVAALLFADFKLVGSDGRWRFKADRHKGGH